MIELFLLFAIVLDVGVFDPVKAFIKEKTQRQSVSQVLLQSDMIFVLQISSAWVAGLGFGGGVCGRGLAAFRAMLSQMDHSVPF